MKIIDVSTFATNIHTLFLQFCTHQLLCAVYGAGQVTLKAAKMAGCVDATDAKGWTALACALSTQGPRTECAKDLKTKFRRPRNSQKSAEILLEAILSSGITRSYSIVVVSPSILATSYFYPFLILVASIAVLRDLAVKHSET